MKPYGQFGDQEMKHLEMVQAVITRLSNEGFVVKGWAGAVTVAGIFFGLAVNASEWQLALVSVVPTCAFWVLDARFLWAEGLFRALYDRVRSGSEERWAAHPRLENTRFVGTTVGTIRVSQRPLLCPFVLS